MDGIVVASPESPECSPSQRLGVPHTNNSPNEAIVRNALRLHVLEDTFGARDTIDEFWVPRSNERADLAVIGRRMDGFEIKTERDNLRRLPRQAAAYGRLFDRCTVVVAEKHCEGAANLIPDWWGITTVHVNGKVSFSVVREAKTNRNIDPETLVRLLWRDEAMSALIELGCEPERRAPRNSLWLDLLRATTLDRLRSIVRHAILGRNPGDARIATRRFTSMLSPALESGQ